MPRRSRIVVPGIPLHIIQRGNNRQACFFVNEDYLFYLDWLEELSQRSRCLVHAFVLMINHVHLPVTPEKADSAGIPMKRLGQRYVQYKGVEKIGVTLCSSAQIRRKGLPCKTTWFQRDRLIVSTPLIRKK